MQRSLLSNMHNSGLGPNFRISGKIRSDLKSVGSDSGQFSGLFFFWVRVGSGSYQKKFDLDLDIKKPGPIRPIAISMIGASLHSSLSLFENY